MISGRARRLSAMMFSTKRRGDGFLHQVRHRVVAGTAILRGVRIRSAGVAARVRHREFIKCVKSITRAQRHAAVDSCAAVECPGRRRFFVLPGTRRFRERAARPGSSHGTLSRRPRDPAADLEFCAVVAVVIAVVISWFAALFTGRVPEGLQTFNFSTSFATPLRCRPTPRSWWRAGRVSLLTRAIAHRCHCRSIEFKLNRAAVFFRYFLGLPAGVVFFVVNFASYVLTLAAWISALILGRPARPIYQARLLCLRYSARYTAYGFMLTPTQPFEGLFGDSVVPDVGLR